MTKTPPSSPEDRPAPGSADASAAKGERIAKVIARAGLASRREAERMITEGRVSVNGAVIYRAALNVTRRDKVLVDGKLLGAPDEAKLWLYHKPTGLVTTTKDEQGRPTIYDDLPEELPRVMSVGRLDLNSEGLLLLTNDGGIKRKLELPSTGWLRRYRVRVNGRPDDETLEPLRRGIEVDGQRFLPMIVDIDRQQGANAWLTIGLREGKNREIRRAMADIGLTVNRLIRISYGPFQLGDLEPGGVLEVRRRVMQDQLGLPADPDAPARKRVDRMRKPVKPKPESSVLKTGGRGRTTRPEEPARRDDDGRPFRAKGRPARMDRPERDGVSRGKPGGKPAGKPWKSHNPDTARDGKPAGKPWKSHGPDAARDGKPAGKPWRDKTADGTRDGKPGAKGPGAQKGGGYGDKRRPGPGGKPDGRRGADNKSSRGGPQGFGKGPRKGGGSGKPDRTR
ncbi:pseudouridine synthase [Cognatishimia sp. F0-27]|uniref:pseudouridine synthase n=1 Tax=Cognatishimia sp. F0-27 TaxID=2816855 RepID=UPI001D0C6B5B|nr:pseudouridine synthase [Cognatishimia sp. F0-27]